MAEVRAGVVLASELTGPMPSVSNGKMFDLNSPATWAMVFFIIACVLLFVV